MLIPEYTAKFKKDLKAVQRRNADIQLLKDIIVLLCEEVPLQKKNRDHSLKGNWSDYRECHVQPDWLLVYKVFGDTILFERTGSHSDLF